MNARYKKHLEPNRLEKNLPRLNKVG